MKSPVTRLRENIGLITVINLAVIFCALLIIFSSPKLQPEPPKPKTITKIITTTPTISKRTVETEEFLPGRVMPKTRRKVTFEYGEVR